MTAAVKNTTETELIVVSTNSSPASGPVVDLSEETHVSGLEWGLLAALLVGSLYYLYGKYFRRKKASVGGGCAGCGQKGGCPVASTASKS